MLISLKSFFIFQNFSFKLLKFNINNFKLVPNNIKLISRAIWHNKYHRFYYYYIETFPIQWILHITTIRHSTYIGR